MQIPAVVVKEITLHPAGFIDVEFQQTGIRSGGQKKSDGITGEIQGEFSTGGIGMKDWALAKACPFFTGQLFPNGDVQLPCVAEIGVCGWHQASMNQAVVIKKRKILLPGNGLSLRSRRGKRSGDRVGINLVSEGSRVDAAKLFPVEFTGTDSSGNFLCEIQGRQSIMFCDPFMGSDLPGNFTGLIIGQVTLIGGIEKDDIHGRVVAQSLADNSFHRSNGFFRKQMPVLIVVDCEFDKKQIDATFVQNILLDSESAGVGAGGADSCIDELKFAAWKVSAEEFFRESGISIHFGDGAAEKCDMGCGFGVEESARSFQTLSQLAGGIYFQHGVCFQMIEVAKGLFEGFQDQLLIVRMPKIAEVSSLGKENNPVGKRLPIPVQMLVVDEKIVFILKNADFWIV